MAILHLSDEQIRTMTVEEKDRWWLENVYKGDVPQFTARAVVCGFFLGSLLSMTNLYVGAKTGWTLGVGITSVILAYVLFKFLIRVGLADDFSILENNIMQSIATAAGYMTAPLISSLAAYMMIKHIVVPWQQALPWLIGLAILGVLFAFPMKRRFINDEQHPFPEGRAAGVVMDTLHSHDDPQAALGPRLLIWSSVLSALAKLGQSEKIMSWLNLEFRIPEFLDGPLYTIGEKLGFVPSIMGTPLKELTVRPELDIAMIGAGGLMGIRTGVSLMIGAVLNYVVLAPWMIQHGDIFGHVGADGATYFGFRPITEWALWGGVAMMTTASLYSFFSKPAMLIRAFQSLFGRRHAREDCLKDIELPMSALVIGIPVVGGAIVYMADAFFGVPIIWAVVAIPMVFVFCLIAAHSTALTSITPTGAMGKLTQLTFAILARGDIATNLMTAGITGEVAGHSSNLIMNIKPGYMLGGKPRLQALAHCVGAVSGAIASLLVFYPLMLRGNPDKLVSDEFPMPAATIWRAVAEILTAGLDALPASAAYAALLGAALGIALEVIRAASKGRFGVSGVGIGLAFVIPFTTCLAMAAGAFLFWVIAKHYPSPEDHMNKIFAQNQEPICAGIIAGAALTGIAIMAFTILVLGE